MFETFCILLALGFILTALGAAAVLFLKGTVGLAGAVCIGFARATGILKPMMHGKTADYSRDLDSRTLWAIFIIVYIAILFLVANIS